MKILHVITGLDVGGAETMLYRLATGMDPVRFSTKVVSLISPGPMGDRLAAAGIPVDSLHMRRGLPSPAGLFRLVRHIRSWRPDVVQTWLYHADLAGLVATRLAFPLGGGPRVAWNIRCSYMALDEYSRMTGATLKACAALSGCPDIVLTNSHEAKRFHDDLGYHPKRWEVIPNGFDVETYAPDESAGRAVRRELSIGNAAPIIGHVARFDAMKDHKTFLRAAARTAQETDAVFVLVGRGVDYDNIDIVTWMTEAGLASERVRLLGEREDVSRLMAAMDLHVSSSLGESFPNVVGETMACGVPNVVTDVGDSRLLVGGTGLVAKPGEASELAAAMTHALRNPKERKAMGAAARERIVMHYSLPATLAHFSDVYETLQEKAL